MNDRMPCITDSDEFRYEPDGEEMELTLAEQRVDWLFDEWQTAITEDTYDAWRDVRMMCYGATQACNVAGFSLMRGVDPRDELRLLGGVAFENSLRCIREGKYEGAPQ